MLKTIISGVLATAVVLGAMTASAEQANEGQTLQPAKIVVYRAEEATRTQQVKFQVQLDRRSLGRLKYDDMVVSEVAPGTYQLGTSLNGGEVLEICRAVFEAPLGWDDVFVDNGGTPSSSHNWRSVCVPRNGRYRYGPCSATATLPGK